MATGSSPDASRCSSSAVADSAHAAAGRARERLLADVLARVAAEGPLLAGELEPPRCSVTYGASGIAYMMYRLAGLHNDAGMLSLADLWSVRALRDPQDYHSFYSSAID